MNLMTLRTVSEADIEEAGQGGAVVLHAPAGEVLVLRKRNGSMVIDKYTEEVYNALTAGRGERGGHTSTPNPA